jgi:HEPN domain-containing protein
MITESSCEKERNAMSSITIRTKIESETIHLPELKPLIGKQVKIIIHEVSVAGSGDWDAALQAARKLENYDFSAWQEPLTLKEETPTDSVCFHCQQAIEKYLKALLIFRAIPFPKTHDLRVLMRLLPARVRPGLDRKDRARLTKYAAVTRYPNPGQDITLAQARREVAIARRVRREVRRLLPRASLRKKK